MAIEPKRLSGFRHVLGDRSVVEETEAVVGETSLEAKVDSLGAFMLLGAVFGEPELADIDDLCQGVEKVLTTLDERERRVLLLRYGLRDGHYRTYEEVGGEFEVTRERIRQIEMKALRKLRHPTRSRFLLSAIFSGTVRNLSRDLEGLSKVVKNIKEEADRAARDIAAERMAELYELGDATVTPIADMGLPASILQALRRAGLRYAYEILDGRKLQSLRGVGEVGLARIGEALIELGLKRRGEGEGA